MPEDDGEMNGGQTAVLPTGIIGDQQVSPGDDITLRVVSVDDEGITVEYAHPEAAEEPPEDGLDYMARTGAKRPMPMMESES